MNDKRDKLITINAPDTWTDDYCHGRAVYLLSQLFSKHLIVYGLIGIERGGTTNNLHMQGFIQGTQKTGDVWWSKKCADFVLIRGHVETRKGTVEQAISYIKEPEQHGKPPSKWIEVGKPEPRTGGIPFRVLVDQIKTKKLSFNELKESLTADYLLHERKFNTLQKLVEVPRVLEKKVYWLYGKTGTGKTETAYKMGTRELEHPYFWIYGETLQAYNGERTLVLDDFRGELPYSFLLRLLDKYPMRISIKFGEARLLMADTIFITSDRHYTQLWPNEVDTLRTQLSRRITKCICTDEPYTLE